MGKKIAVFPEPGAIGPVMNLVGICQGLKEMGHDPVFVLEPGLKGTVESYGFEERHVSCMEPMSPEAQATYWDDFMIKYMPTFKTSAYEQVATYVKGCWEAIIYTSEWSVKNGLDKVFAEIKPDLIINDNVALYPATEQAGCPWVRMISCSENEIIDPDIPPHLSGCSENDKAGFEAYRAEFEKEVKPLHDGFMDLLKSHYEVIVNKDTICFVYEPIACHSYNVIKIKDIRYRIATIDTMLSFYLLFIYLDKPYYNIDRILCMSQFLFDVQQKNRLSQKGLLRRFSISCYGNQKSIGDIFQEKSKLMRELSVNPDEKKKEKWFLKYRPESNKSISRTRKMKFTFDDISNDETGVFTSIALKTINKTRKKRKKKKVPLKNALSFPLNILKDF